MIVKKKTKNKVIMTKTGKFDFEFWLDSLPTIPKCIIYFIIEFLLSIVYTFYLKDTANGKPISSAMWDMTYCFFSIGATRFGLRGLSFFKQMILYTLAMGIGHLLAMYI